MFLELKKEIEDFLTELGVTSSNVNWSVPENTKFGDYSTNVAMMYGKMLDRKPLDLAEDLKQRILSKKFSQVSKIDVIAPGFINLFFTPDFFSKSISDAQSLDYGLNKNLSEQKYFIEHTQPNPFKEFHIGHLMNNSIGESISRVIKANGAEVKTCSYHGDVGLHVAKAVWAMSQGVDFEGAYASGNKSYEEDEKAKEEIIETNKKIYDRSDSKINEIYDSGKKKSLDKFENIYEKLDSHFDFHFYENESGEIGKKLVLDNMGKVFEESEGATVFKGEKFGLHTRVFLNSEKLPTYEAKELGLAHIKREKYPGFDTSLTVTANEQDSFFKVVEVAIGEVFPELKGILTHISHGMLKLPDGKMSSRTGNIISAESLINQVKEKVLEKMKDREMSQEQIENVAEQVSVGAIKYSILRQAIGGDIIFDFDKSISFEGDSGPYLQYATVRAKSLLKKAAGSVKPSEKIPDGWQTTNLERLIERFPAIVLRAGTEYEPHHIVTYLVELAGEFNLFYATHKIIDSDDPTSPYRLAITGAFANIMTSGINLLGIKIPEQM